MCIYIILRNNFKQHNTHAHMYIYIYMQAWIHLDIQSGIQLRWSRGHDPLRTELARKPPGTRRAGLPETELVCSFCSLLVSFCFSCFSNRSYWYNYQRTIMSGLYLRFLRVKSYLWKTITYSCLISSVSIWIRPVDSSWQSPILHFICWTDFWSFMLGFMEWDSG